MILCTILYHGMGGNPIGNGDIPVRVNYRMFAKDISENSILLFLFLAIQLKSPYIKMLVLILLVWFNINGYFGFKVCVYGFATV